MKCFAPLIFLPVFSVVLAEPDLIGTGTGFVVAKNYVLTAAHVLEECDSATVRFNHEEIRAEIVAMDVVNDLGLLKTDTDFPAAARFRGGKLIRLGETVVNFGYPLFGELSDHAKITKGEINSLAGWGNNSGLLQYDAATQPGNSGGPVLDQSGNVVGVVSSLLSKRYADETGHIAQNVNFAVKSYIAEGFLSANGINYEVSLSEEVLNTVDIAENAAKFTMLVNCWEGSADPKQLAPLVKEAAFSESEKQMLALAEKTYDGVYNDVPTTLELFKHDDGLFGTYSLFYSAQTPDKGTLRLLELNEVTREFLFEWIDVYGRGLARFTFDADFQSFDGTWGKGNSFDNGGKWSGEWNKKATDIIEYPGGAVYEGSVVEREADGLGFLSFPDGTIVIGEWGQGSIDHSGVYKYSGGSVYAGQFKDNNFHGRGALIDVNGERFVGQWKDDEIWDGVFFDSSGNVGGTYSKGSFCETCRPDPAQFSFFTGYCYRHENHTIYVAESDCASDEIAVDERLFQIRDLIESALTSGANSAVRQTDGDQSTDHVDFVEAFLSPYLLNIGRSRDFVDGEYKSDCKEIDGRCEYSIEDSKSILEFSSETEDRHIFSFGFDSGETIGWKLVVSPQGSYSTDFVNENRKTVEDVSTKYPSLEFHIEEYSPDGLIFYVASDLVRLKVALGEIEPERSQEVGRQTATIDWWEGTYSGDVSNGLPDGKGRWTHRDGAQYDGEFKDGVMSGSGTFIFKGTKYIGEMEDNVMHGWGRYSDQDSQDSFVYVGEFKEGKFQGWGTYTYADGGKYVGEFSDDDFNGIGYHDFADGNFLIGHFKADTAWEGLEFASDGQLWGYYADGSFIEFSSADVRTIKLWEGTYTGQLLNGVPHGWGSWSHPDGDHVIGKFNSADLHGVGVYVFPDGSRYAGQYKRNLRNGSGMYFFDDESSSFGEFIDGKNSGYGIYIYSDGNRYQGNFVADEFRGHGKFFYASGDKYVGEFANDQSNGQGTYTFSSGEKYVGEFKDDDFHGQGTYTYSDGSKFIGEHRNNERWNGIQYDNNGKEIESFSDGLASAIGDQSTSDADDIRTIDLWGGIYTGEVSNGVPDGEGTWTHPDGDKYVGAFKNKMFHGQGIYTYANGSKYVGEFENDEATGQGTYIHPDGDKYVGAFKNMTFHGQGTYTYPDGGKYVGEFANNAATGQGTYIHPDGDKYVGEFKNWEYHGQGTYTYPDGGKYVGAFTNDAATGRGTYIHPDGDKYVGEFKNWEYHGQGTYTYADGGKYVGEFANNAATGRGTHTYGAGELEGDKYVGEFKNWEYHGQGTYTRSDGMKFVGEFNDGEKWNGVQYDKDGKEIASFSDGLASAIGDQPVSDSVEKVSVKAVTEKRVGIGLDLKIANDRLRVAGVIEGSPAYSMEVFQPWGQTKCTPPIKKGDYVKEIDGNDVSKLTPADASILLRGQPGTTVNVKLERRGASTCRYKIKLERAVIGANL
jgi:hypothetical protein